MTGIDLVLQGPDVGVEPPCLRDLLPGFILTGVIHEDDLIAAWVIVKNGGEFPGQRENVRLLVIDGHYDREFWSHTSHDIRGRIPAIEGAALTRAQTAL